MSQLPQLTDATFKTEVLFAGAAIVEFWGAG